MAVTQLDGGRQIKAASVTDTQIATAAGIALSKLATPVVAANGSQALTANLPAGGFTITGLAAPVGANDAATKTYVDSIGAGLDPKASVRAATTTNGALATAYANASVIDGVTLVTGDRILIKDQTTGSENGIYTVNATGAPTRATDADSDAEVTPGMFTFVEQGTVNADSGWVLATDGAVTVGTTALTFTQFSSAASLTAGAGLTKTGSTIDVVSANAGIVANADNIALTLGTASALEIAGSGLRVARGTVAGQIMVASATTFDPTYVAVSGDATLSASGALTIGSTIQRTAGFADRETPTGAMNGTNTAFTLAATPVAGSEHVYLNGILQEPGAGNDYLITGTSITMATAPTSTDRIRVSYRK